MLNQLGQEVGIDCVDDVVEEWSRNRSLLVVVVWQVLHDVFVVLYLGDELLHGEFGVLGNVDEVDIRYGHRLLFSAEQCPVPLPVQVILGWEIHLFLCKSIV